MSKVLSIAMAFCLVLTGCGSTDEATENEAAAETEIQTIRLGVMTGQTQHWIATVGNEKGIYEKHGLKVEVSEFARGIDTVDALVSGSVDIGGLADFALVNRIGSTQDDTDLRIFSSICKTGVSEFYVNPKTVNELSDIKGKTIVTQKGTVTEYWNALTLERAGLTESDVDLAEVENITVDVLALAEKNNIDAAWASGETAKRLEDNYGWKAIISQGELETETYTIAVANNEYLQANKDTVEKFVEANEEIIQYITENFDEVAQVISDASGMELDVFKTTYEGYTISQELSQALYDDLDGIAKWAYENGYYDKEYSLKNYLNTDILSNVSSELVTFTSAD